MPFKFNPLTGKFDMVRESPPAPSDHESSHVDGGSDELDSALDPRAYPMLAGLAASRPTIGVAGRSYFSTDTLVLERDNGTSWVEVARGETATRLAQLSEKAHGSLTGVGASDHHAQTVSSDIDHGSVGGLGDDDHTQYIKDSEFTAADEIIVGTGSGTFGQVTLAASQFLAKKAAGAATNVTAAEARAILNVEDGSTADQTGAEMVALLEALSPGSQLSHDQLDDVSADDHHAQSHKDTHDPRTGGDPLDCAAPGTNITPEQANAEGSADTLARSDHMHYIPSGAPSTVGSANSEGTGAA
ncbi:MAG: hypothetical protein E3J25_04050, partial [Anaerolineales bacterium]